MRTILTRERVAIGIFGVAAGFIAGAFTHTLPEWLCGPFRYDKAAEWSAVLISAIAAAVTFWAVRVAIRSSRVAISVERELREAEVARAEIARRRQAAILAGSFIVDMRHIIIVCTERCRMLDDPRMFALGRNYSGAIRISTPNLDASGGRSDVFDLDEGIAFLRLATAVHRLRKVAETNKRLHAKWSDDMVVHARESLKAHLTSLSEAASEALSIAAALRGRSDDPARWVAVGELAYQRRIKTDVGGFLPGGASSRRKGGVAAT